MILAAASGSQAPDYGQILLDGVSIYQERSRAYRRFGYMPRDYGFYDLLRVDEYFELFLSLYKVNGRYRQKRMEEVAELFGIRQYMSAFIAELPTRDPALPLSGKDRAARSGLAAVRRTVRGSEFCQPQLYDQDASHAAGAGQIDRGEFTDVSGDPGPFLRTSPLVEDGRVVVEGETDDIFETALKKSPVRMHILAGMEEALAVLKENSLVDRVTVDEQDVIFRFNGGQQEEAELLTDLVAVRRIYSELYAGPREYRRSFPEVRR